MMSSYNDIWCHHDADIRIRLCEYIRGLRRLKQNVILCLVLSTKLSTLKIKCFFCLRKMQISQHTAQYDSRNIMPFYLDFTEHCECLTVDHGALSVWASGDFRFLSLVLLKTQSVICTSWNGSISLLSPLLFEGTLDITGYAPHFIISGCCLWPGQSWGPLPVC